MWKQVDMCSWGIMNHVDTGRHVRLANLGYPSRLRTASATGLAQGGRAPLRWRAS